MELSFDGFPVEILKMLAPEGESDTIGTFDEIIVAVWRGDAAPQQWNMQRSRCCTRKIGRSVATVMVSLSTSTPEKYSLKSLLVDFVTSANAKHFAIKKNVGLDPGPQRLAQGS